MKKRTIMAAAVLGAMSIASNAIAGQFPTITAENLNKVEMTLPQDFGARRSIVMIAYTQKQQDDVNTWLPFLGRWLRNLV